MIKYIRYSEKVHECLTTDELGNRVHKNGGEYVILVPETRNPIDHQPEVFVKVNNEWVPKQMEFDFG